VGVWDYKRETTMFFQKKKDASGFTKNEKKTLLDTINVMITYANIARVEGLLTLNEFLDDVPDENFAKKYLKVVIEDCIFETQVLREMMETEVKGIDGLTPFDVLEFQLIIEAILLIMEGENPKVVQDTLNEMVNVSNGYA